MLENNIESQRGTKANPKGFFQLLSHEHSSLVVISDIDDTIKITNVTSNREIIANTLIHEFKAVPHMRDLYGHFFTLAREAYDTRTKDTSRLLLSDSAKYERKTPHASFHYVSSSPDRLNSELENFLSSNGFPAGSMHLKHVPAFSDHRVMSLFASSKKTKPFVIRGIIEAHPEADFILVGDSGENDPSIYADVLRLFPQRVRHVVIRCVETHRNVCSTDSSRFAKDFTNIDTDALVTLLPPQMDAGEVRASAARIMNQITNTEEEFQK